MTIKLGNPATTATSLELAGIRTDLGLATQAEAEAGTDASKLMTPQRVYQAILALASSSLTFLETKTVSGNCKTAAGDPGTFLSVFCVSNPSTAAKISIYNGSAANTGTAIGIGTYPASSNGVAMTTGQFLTLGAAVSCPNGIWVEISGTGTFAIILQ